MARPTHPICCKCHIEMITDRQGVVLVTYFREPPVPYETYNADRYRCPKCGAMVVAGFGSHLAAHYDALAIAREVAAANAAGLREDCFE